ncbi:hypothetical protein [Arthrobacter sp. JCM 19049]|uniref:hypothetical protein n=1 Tax=Arthrobacter sp. JCM 19049 TaxID=1460643 RepID=UPI000AE761CA|nr:hypothetical protein [Arthrobacter sp. JCM 19049]
MLLSLAERSSEVSQQRATPRPPKAAGIAARFDANLPFQLTDEQTTVGGKSATT